jgi:hypothetical protein
MIQLALFTSYVPILLVLGSSVFYKGKDFVMTLIFCICLSWLLYLLLGIVIGLITVPVLFIKDSFLPFIKDNWEKADAIVSKVYRGDTK